MKNKLLAVPYLTSLGVPALFSILTATCTPLASSNARSAIEESTRMHNRVSRSAEASCGGGTFFLPNSPVADVDVSLPGVEGGEDRCRETRSRSRSICKIYE